MTEEPRSRSEVDYREAQVRWPPSLSALQRIIKTRSQTAEGTSDVPQLGHKAETSQLLFLRQDLLPAECTSWETGLDRPAGSTGG